MARSVAHPADVEKHLVPAAECEELSESLPPPPSISEFRAWSMRGSPYYHMGECLGDACTFCYKYSCGRCGERSNFMMTCCFCSSTQKTDSSDASAVSKKNEEDLLPLAGCS